MNYPKGLIRCLFVASWLVVATLIAWGAAGLGNGGLVVVVAQDVVSTSTATSILTSTLSTVSTQTPTIEPGLTITLGSGVTITIPPHLGPIGTCPWCPIEPLPPWEVPLELGIAKPGDLLGEYLSSNIVQSSVRFLPVELAGE